jgi:hypothetical protein
MTDLFYALILGYFFLGGGRERIELFTEVGFPGSIPSGVAEDIFRGSDGTMCPGVDSASEIEYQGFVLG